MKSFSKAAKAVYLTQPTVSSHIKELETECGCQLIDRLGREVAPTKAGRLIYQYACKLLRLRDEAKSALADFLGEMRGRLIIGASTIPGTYILPRFIGHFNQSNPEVNICLLIGGSERTLERILDGSVEMGCVGAKTDNPHLDQYNLMTDEMRLIALADHTCAAQKQLHLATLTQLPFIIRETGSGTLQTLATSLSEAGKSISDLKVVAEMGTTAAVVQGIKHGLGVSILSPIAVEDEIESGRLCALKVKGLNLRRHFYLVTHKDRSQSPICKAFIAFVKAQAAPLSSFG